MNEIREIGIEKELFLKDSDGYIKKPKLYGFPRDEFEFLVEIRSLPSDRFYPVYTTLKEEELQYSLRANKFSMQLDDKPGKHVTPDWVQNHWNEFNLHNLSEKDYTENIYNSSGKSHHQGVLDASLENMEMKKLTAGIHVHFSSRNSENGEIIQLPIKKIVRMMDEEFEDTINEASRNLGEWEPKQHGFEYRSLPSNSNIYDVLKKSFKVIRSV